MTNRLIGILSRARANLSYPVEVVHSPSYVGAEIYTPDKDLPSSFDKTKHNSILVNKKLRDVSFEKVAGAYIYQLSRYGEYVSAVRSSVKATVETILIDSVSGVPILLSTITVPSGTWTSLLGFPVNIFAIHPSSILQLRVTFDKTELWLKDNPVIEGLYVSCNDSTRRETQDRGYVALTEIERSGTKARL